MPLFSFLPMLLLSLFVSLVGSLTHQPPPPPSIRYVPTPPVVIYQPPPPTTYITPIAPLNGGVRTPVRFNMIDRPVPQTTVFVD